MHRADRMLEDSAVGLGLSACSVALGLFGAFLLCTCGRLFGGAFQRTLEVTEVAQRGVSGGLGGVFTPTSLQQSALGK